MIASIVSQDTSTAIDTLKSDFMAILPYIETHARIYFRDIRCADQKADKISETVALTWKWFVRLAERGKNAAAFKSTLATFAARAVRCGRRICGQDKSKDVLSPRAQQRFGFVVTTLPISTYLPFERLDRDIHAHGHFLFDAFEERLRENTMTPVADQVAFRLDFPKFLLTLSERDRRMVEYLSLGNSADSAAKKFAVSPGRIAQLRQQLCREWHTMHGETAPCDAKAKKTN
jgi:hypothetical protein